MADENMLSFSLKKNTHTSFLPGYSLEKSLERYKKPGKGATSLRGGWDVWGDEISSSCSHLLNFQHVCTKYFLNKKKLKSIMGYIFSSKYPISTFEIIL